MKKSLKIIACIVVILIVIWGIIFFIDYSRCSNFKEPIFVVAGVTADDGGSGTYYGLGYKVEMEKTISAKCGPELVKVEMYILDKFITGAIADTANGKDKAYEEYDVKQYEFVGTIIEANKSYIIVEPEQGTTERKSSDKISVGINRPTNGINDFYIVGNKVKIMYNGNIMESYPAKIIATKIELIN